jgi:glutamyl-tRNA synthetase
MNAGMNPVRVRFAPSPTGSLHVGGARTALFNWLLAKKTNGKFIIRVEDTDEARSTRESEQSILNDVKWMNMMWDEGPEIGGPCEPYRQSERKDIYKKFAEKLIADGKAYRCFCSEEELDLKRQQAEEAGLDSRYDGTWANADPAVVAEKLANGDPYTVRFRVPKGKVVSFNDIVRGTVTWDADAMLGDFIILRFTCINRNLYSTILIHFCSFVRFFEQQFVQLLSISQNFLPLNLHSTVSSYRQLF